MKFKKENINYNNYIYKYINIIRNKSIKKINKNKLYLFEYEKWKNYDISSIMDYEYSFPIKEKKSIYLKLLNKYVLDVDGFYLFFINGFYIYNFFKKKNKNFLSLNDIIINNKSYCNSNIEKFYGKTLSNNDNLNYFNFLFSKDGAYIYIPDGIFFKKNIYIIYLYNIRNDYSIINPRNLIILGKKTKAKIIEIHESLTNKIFISNSVTEIFHEKKSYLDYIKIQNNLSFSYLKDNTLLTQKNNSYCSINTFSFEGRLLNNNINFFNCGNNSKFYLNGLTIIKNKSLNQIIDNKILINHLYPNCESNQTYKYILNGRSKGIFNGIIKVHKNANNINALQKNDNILISNKSFIYTKPELKIYANNVKCTHGCTIGKIDNEKIFYFRSRGIKKKIAKSILLFLFSKEILKKINIYNIKIYIYNIIIYKLKIFNLNLI